MLCHMFGILTHRYCPGRPWVRHRVGRCSGARLRVGHVGFQPDPKPLTASLPSAHAQITSFVLPYSSCSVTTGAAHCVPSRHHGTC